MRNQLDLRPLISATFELILSETEELHLCKPSEPMLQQIGKLESDYKSGESNLLKDMHLLDGLVKQVLDNNIEKRTVSIEQAQALPLDAKMALIEAYTKWAMSFDSPNSAAPTFPAIAETAGRTP